ncbi:MAG: methyltransferase domain-containing protein [Patescibacteria group bacterium]|nr:methyltransferase domain-containing protein [Patescibacteria group bacterium]
MPKIITELKEKGVLRSQAIVRALEDVDRADFLPEDLHDVAYEDTALPIDGGQTISQPYTVVFMLEQLHVRPGDIVLDIGYGSGWQTALLAHLVGPSGKVYAFEVVPMLCEQGKEHLEKYPSLAPRIQFLCMSAQNGYAKAAPFDRIVSAAAVREAPKPWHEQLLPGGRMVYPKGNSLILEVKKPDGHFDIKEFPGFVFVPFVEA